MQQIGVYIIWHSWKSDFVKTEDFLDSCYLLMRSVTWRKPVPQARTLWLDRDGDMTGVSKVSACQQSHIREQRNIKLKKNTTYVKDVNLKLSQQISLWREGKDFLKAQEMHML